MTERNATQGLSHIRRAADQITLSLNIYLLNSSTGVVFNDVYTASKFAIEGFCESMAVQLLKFNVK